MASRGTILVGTVGQGVMRSPDGGASWGRVGVGMGIHSDAIVRCLTPHPRQPEIVYAGTDQGLLRSDDAGSHWHRIDSPMNGKAVWQVVIDTDYPEAMLAGTGTPTPASIYRSTDGGESWQPCAAEIAESCPAVGVPRPTAIAIDPANHSSVWLGLEVDGVRRSRDGGATWDRAATSITNLDVHNVLVTAGRVFVLVNDDVWVSDDDGASWQAIGVKQVFPWHYPRGVAARPDDPNVVFITVGDATPGRTGAIMRSTDVGHTWESMPLSNQPNSAMWTVTTSRFDPDLMIAGSRYGHLFRSEDGGRSWTKFWRELSEIASLAWLPA